jgi:signal transduction histidine kinase
MESIESLLESGKTIITQPLYIVLLADEDKNSWIKDLIEKFPEYQIREATNIQDAEKALEDKKWDLAIMESKFDKIKGRPFLNTLLNIPGKPVFIISGKYEREEDIENMKMGAEGYFSKEEINPELFERAIRYSLEKEKNFLATEKREAEQRNGDKLLAISHISRTIAHEVRNPLTNVNLSIEQLKNEINSKDESLEMYFDIIGRNCERINSLITELLNATKPPQIETSQSSLNEIADQAISMAEDKIKAKEIIIKKEFTEEKNNLSVDVNKVKQAIFNILVNSIEALEPKKGIITIKTFTKKNKCILQVSDNGPGVTKENKNRIFDPFYNGRSKSIGLGLTSAQNIILNHNGKIEVEDEDAPGLTFTVTFNKH